MDFAVLAEHKGNINDNEKIDKYLDLVRELKKKPMEYEGQVNTNCCWLDQTVPRGRQKGLDKLEINRRIETIQILVMQRLDRILRRIQEAWKDLLSLGHQWKTIGKC